VLRLFLVASAVSLLLVAESEGQSGRSRETIYSSQTVDGVPLQPFSFDRQSRNQQDSRILSEPARAQAIQVAYYVPRPTRRVEPIQRDEYDSEAQTPGFDIGGSHPMVPGNRAVLRNGIAYAPANAPDSVKHAIWAVNSIRNRPYVWGGGHGSFSDYGYDCSGTVSFALHYAGMLGQPLPSSDFLRYGERGRGRWVTIYSRHGHVFAMIAGLRLDTTDLRYGSDVGPRWHVDGRDAWGFQARHPVGL
jgi:cell wall-associated NlpC family hydrolase